MPGAVFVGPVSDADLEVARHMQRIRADYESDDCQATLWHELTRMNCDYDEIAAAVLNPATLTSCVYSSDWRSLGLLPALIAVETAA